MFIVFEGVDGSGKSIPIGKLAKFLTDLDKHNHVLVTREPYKELEIRQILQLNEPAEKKAEKLLELFVKDRARHINELIIPNLEKDIIVISDRYKYSTIAYQAAQGIDINKLIDMHKDMPVPDFVFIIDTPVEIAKKRMAKDSRNEQKFERDLEFQEKVRQNYLKLKELLPEENIIIIDGFQDIEEIFQDIKKCLS